VGPDKEYRDGEKHAGEKPAARQSTDARQHCCANTAKLERFCSKVSTGAPAVAPIFRLASAFHMDMPLATVFARMILSGNPHTPNAVGCALPHSLREKEDHSSTKIRERYSVALNGVKPVETECKISARTTLLFQTQSLNVTS